MEHESDDDINFNWRTRYSNQMISLRTGGTRGVMVIVVGNGHGDMSSNPGRGRLHFTLH